MKCTVNVTDTLKIKQNHPPEESTHRTKLSTIILYL